MKLLYIVPSINDEGGVARVISTKVNYLIDEFGYDLAILTQNGGSSSPFYDFHEKIDYYDMILKGNAINFLISYKKQVREQIVKINPDLIVVCDNGLKAFLLPYFLKTKIPIVLEIHSSKYVQEQASINFVKSRITNFIKSCGVKRYLRTIVETSESLKEWNLEKGVVIPNPLWFSSENAANLTNKKVIAVGRHVYEKGFDRLLHIWKRVIEKNPDWILEIYGKSTSNNEIQELAKFLEITQNVAFYDPVKNISEKYLDYSIFLMTSRFEGFGMVLIEAMECGLPVIAYDCPVGPRTIISNGEDGFLIEDENEKVFVDKIIELINDENLRKQFGKNAKENGEKYSMKTIMQKWNLVFNEIISSYKDNQS